MNKKLLILFVFVFIFFCLAGALFRPQKAEATTETLSPNASGDQCQISSQFGCMACPNHHGCVLVSNGDTTYIHTNAISWQRDLYNFTDSTINGGTINSVTVYAVAKRTNLTNQTSLKLAIKTGGTVSEGSEQTLTTNYATYWNTWSVKPGGGAWAWSDISNLQAGVSIRRPYSLSSLYTTRVTQVYIKVDYTLNMCKKPDEWNDQGECSVEIVYQDFMPGSGLETCYYRIRNRINGGHDDSPALQPVPCGGASTTYYALMEIDPAGTCSALGEAACMVEATAVDIAGNAAIATSTYNVMAHNLEVVSLPITGIPINGDPPAYSSTTNYQISDILPGTDIELTALETHIDAGILYYFDSWDEGPNACDSVVGRTCYLTMNTDKEVTAEYLIGPYPPTNLQESWDPCAWGSLIGQQVAPGLNLTLRWDYDHPQGESQDHFELRISDSVGNSATTTQSSLADPGDTVYYLLELNHFGNWKNTQCNHSAAVPGFGQGLCWNSYYYWQVKVRDDQGNWSGWSSPVKETSQRTSQHAWPNPDFSYQPDNVMVGEIIQFTDESKAYSPSATTTAWDWQFQNGTPSSSIIKNPTTTFSVATTTKIDLRVWDSPNNYSCAMYDYINIALPLPDYREVAPR